MAPTSNLTRRPPSSRRIRKRRRSHRPRIERLEDRRVLAAAIDLAEINGRVFDDFTGDGYTAGEEVSGVSLQLYRDDGDSIFEPGTGDSLVNTMQTDAAGLYTFERLAAGSYFVLQAEQTVGGHSLRRTVSPLQVLNSTDVQGRIVALIDNFDTTTQSVRDEVADGVPVTSSVAAVEAIGGERDLFANKTSVNGAVQLSVDDPLLPDLLTFDSIATGIGERKISWDGPDGTALTIDDAGLAGLDLASAGDAAGLRLQVGADLVGGTAIVRIYSDDGGAGTSTRFSSATIPIPATGGAPSSAEFIEFTTFTAAPGGAADFANIGAIELEITGAANVNGSAELVGTIGANSTVQDFSNFESADLALAISVDDATPTVGQNVSYVVTVRNDGPDTATAVIVSESLPSGVTLNGQNVSTGTYSTATGQWSIPTLASGATATLTLTGRVDTVGVKSNTAEIVAAGQLDSDSTPNNNLISEDDQASVDITPETIDLSLTTQVSNSAPSVGSTVTFTATVANAGPDTATNVTISSPVPSGLTFTDQTPSQGSFNSTSGLWSVGSLASGATASLSIVGTVSSTGAITYAAQVTAADQSDTDSTPNNNVPSEDDQDSVSVSAPIADLSVTQQVSNTTPNVGDTIDFVITVANAGPDNATNVSVADQLPAGLTLTGNTPSQGSYALGVWTVGSLAASVTATLTLTARVDIAGVKTNTASVSASDQSDPDSTPGNSVGSEDDQASVTITPRTIDLSLSQAASNLRPAQGDSVVLTINVSNAGPDTATSVVVTDTLPAGLQFVSSTSGNFNGNTGIWNVGSIAAGATSTLAITATFGSAVAITNTAQVSSAVEFDIDSTPANNLESEDDQASVTINPATADLSLTKTVDDATPSVGDTVTFTIRVDNAGPDAATAVQIRDLLPSGLTYSSHTQSTGTYVPGTGVWSVPSIGATSSATLTLRAVATTNGQLSNTAEVIASDQLDPDSTPGNGLANEDDQATIQLQAEQIDLALTHTISDSAPNVGDEITLSIVAANVGPNTATGVEVTQLLPAGVTFVRSVPSQGSFNTTSRVWTVGSVAAGQQATIGIVVRVDSIGSGTATAEVTAADQFDVDSTPANGNAAEDDRASVSYTTPSADLAISHAVDIAAPNVGQTIRLTTTLTNTGPDAATAVTVLAPLPSGLRYISNNLSAGSYDQTSGLWTVAAAINSTSTLEIIAEVETQGSKTMTARVESSAEADPDSTPGNNVAGEDDQAAITVTPPVVDLSLTHAVNPLRPAVGESITLTTVVTNAGPDAASGVTVQTTLPAGFSFTSSVPAGQFNSATGIWTVGSLASGGSTTLQVIGTIAAAGTGVSDAEVATTDQFDTDSTPGNGVAAEDDQAAVTVATASADLSLTTTVDQPEPNLGSQVVYSVVVRNDGPDTAMNVAVEDALPTGMTFNNASTVTGTYSSPSNTWNVGTLTSGGQATLQIFATVNSLGTKTYSAQVSASSQFDPDSTPANSLAAEDDQASAALTPQQIDLALTQALDNTVPNIGDTVVYTLSLRNDGPSVATGVSVRDRLPAGVTFTNSTPSQGSYDSATGTWTAGTLANAGTATLLIRGTVGQSLGVTNTAEVFAADQPDADSTPANNIVGEDDLATTVFTTQQSDLQLTQVVSNASPNQGETVTFTLSLENSGPNDATAVSVRNTLPAGLTYVSATPSTGTFDAATGIWSIANAVNQSVQTLAIRATVDAQGSLANTAEVVAVDQFDPDSTPGNGLVAEDDFTSVAVAAPVVDVSVASSVDNPTPIENEVIQITVTTSNAIGSATATSVQVRSLLPAGLTLLSNQPQTGTYDVGTGIWALGSLAAGGSSQLVLSARVDTRGFKTIPIEVISVDQFDSDSTPDNNVDGEDDQSDLIIRAPRILTKRLFLSR